MRPFSAFLKTARFWRAVFLLSFIFIIFSQNCFAQTVPQSPLDRILQQKDLEKQQEKLFKKPVQKERFYFKGKSQKDDKYCIQVEKISFEGADKLSLKEQNKLTKNIIGKCIYNDQIGELLNNITNYYIDKGYTNARAYFDKYNSKNKTIYLKIAIGKIHSIKLNNIKNKEQKNNISDSFFDKSQIFFAFPTSSGKIFDIADMEQGISQMNRLRSNNVAIDIKPSEESGESDIVVNNYKNNNSLELGIGYDNSGSKSTGLYNTTYIVNQDNLLKINDNLNFSKIKSDSSNTDIASFSMPFGYYNFNYSHSSNDYSSYTDNGIRISGTSKSDDYSISRLLLRKKSYELNLNTNLNFRNSTRKTAGVTTLYSQRLSVGRVGLDYIFRKEKFALALGITYSKGLTINDAIDDKDSEFPLKKDSPKAQFEKLSYNLNLYKPLGKYFTYNIQANGQYSPDALYSSELLYIGGNRYTVRGLEYNGLSGASSGGYAKNDLSFNLKEIIGTSDNKVINYGLNLARNIKPYIFYDSGYIKQIVGEGENSKNEYISGSGVGIKYYGKYLNGEVSYARNIHAPDYVIKSNDYKKDAVYFGISGKYWLF